MNRVLMGYMGNSGCTQLSLGRSVRSGSAMHEEKSNCKEICRPPPFPHNRLGAYWAWVSIFFNNIYEY